MTTTFISEKKQFSSEAGGIGLQEHRRIIEEARLFFEIYDESWFSDWDGSYNVPAQDRVGYKRMINGTLHFYVLPESFKKGLCGGYDPKLVAKVCINAGMLVPSNEKNRIQKSVHLPGSGRIRVYHFNSSVLSNAKTIRQNKTHYSLMPYWAR